MSTSLLLLSEELEDDEDSDSCVIWVTIVAVAGFDVPVFESEPVEVSVGKWLNGGANLDVDAAGGCTRPGIGIDIDAVDDAVDIVAGSSFLISSSICPIIP